MTFKDKVSEAIVGGLGGLAVVVIFIVVRSWSSGATDADWLSFAGAIIGTGLAVAGAVWIEHSKRENERISATKAILASIKRIRAVAKTMSQDRPENLSQDQWQSVINELPKNLMTYSDRLDRSIARFANASTDFNLLEAGDMVLREAKHLQSLWISGNPDKASQIVSSSDLLQQSCEVAVAMIESRINRGKPMTFDEAIEGRGERISGPADHLEAPASKIR